MSRVTVWIIARGEPPALRSIAFELTRVGVTVLVVDAHVIDVLGPIVGITVFEAARIQSTERVVTEKVRAAIGHAQLQGNIVVGPVVQKGAARGEAPVVHLGIARIARMTGRQHVGHQAFVPAADLVVQGPAGVGTTEPIEEVAATLGIPTPFQLLPESRDTATDFSLRGSVALEIL